MLNGFYNGNPAGIDILRIPIHLWFRCTKLNQLIVRRTQAGISMLMYEAQTRMKLTLQATNEDEVTIPLILQSRAKDNSVYKLIDIVAIQIDRRLCISQG